MEGAEKMSFGLDQYDRMAELAKTIKGNMIISVNNIPEMRKAFDELTMEMTEITYTAGGSQRSARRSELIIRNFLEFSMLDSEQI